MVKFKSESYDMGSSLFNFNVKISLFQIINFDPEPEIKPEKNFNQSEKTCN